MLVVLVRQSGRLVTKDELLAQVWPESFVEEGILNVHVAALRKALGDDTRPPAYIETVVRSGYRFIAAVRFDSGDDKPFHPMKRSTALIRPSRTATQHSFTWRSHRIGTACAVTRGSQNACDRCTCPTP